MDWDTILEENMKQIFSNYLLIKELTASQAKCFLPYSCSSHASGKLQAAEVFPQKH